MQMGREKPRISSEKIKLEPFLENKRERTAQFYCSGYRCVFTLHAAGLAMAGYFGASELRMGEPLPAYKGSRVGRVQPNGQSVRNWLVAPHYPQSGMPHLLVLSRSLYIKLWAFVLDSVAANRRNEDPKGEGSHERSDRCGSTGSATIGVRGLVGKIIWTSKL